MINHPNRKKANEEIAVVITTEHRGVAPVAETDEHRDLCAGGVDPGWDECPKCGATCRIRNMIIDECAKCVPTNWCDVLLTGDKADPTPLTCRGVEKLLRGIQDRIRALKTAQGKQE